MLHRSHRRLVGFDVYDKPVMRRIYTDDSFREFVKPGKYDPKHPKALVSLDYFVEHFMHAHAIRIEESKAFPRN